MFNLIDINRNKIINPLFKLYPCKFSVTDCNSFGNICGPVHDAK